MSFLLALLLGVDLRIEEYKLGRIGLDPAPPASAAVRWDVPPGLSTIGLGRTDLVYTGPPGEYRVVADIVSGTIVDGELRLDWDRVVFDVTIVGDDDLPDPDEPEEPDDPPSPPDEPLSPLADLARKHALLVELPKDRLKSQMLALAKVYVDLAKAAPALPYTQIQVMEDREVPKVLGGDLDAWQPYGIAVGRYVADENRRSPLTGSRVAEMFRELDRGLRRAAGEL